MLVAIAIPVFNASLIKAQQATDLANIRAAYADAAIKAVETGADASATTVKMTHTGTFNSMSGAEIGNSAFTAVNVSKGSTYTVTVDGTTGNLKAFAAAD